MAMAKDREKDRLPLRGMRLRIAPLDGRCPACGSWNTLVEEKAVPVRDAGAPGAVQRLSEVSTMQAPRVSTGMSSWTA